MEFSWYRGLNLADTEPPYLTPDNIAVGTRYAVDGPDCIGDQYFEGLETSGTNRARWLVAETVPSDPATFEALPIVTIEVLENRGGTMIRVQTVANLLEWMESTLLEPSDTVNSIYPTLLNEEPLRSLILSPPLDRYLWVCPDNSYHPLKHPNRLKAVFIAETSRGRRCVVMPFSQETCYLTNFP
ncbi:MAG: hypothetical protein ACRENH_07305 [Gemmatimonadaceae bacterium]